MSFSISPHHLHYHLKHFPPSLMLLYCLNYPLPPWKNCLPQNWSLVPKRLGIADVNNFIYQFWILLCLCRRSNGNPLQYSCLENPMDGGAWWAAVHGVAQSRARLSDFTFTFHFHALEKEMATHSSVLAWRIPGTGEPGGLPSMGSHRVGHG